MSSNIHMYTRGNEAARNMGNGLFFSCQHCHHTTIVTSFSYSRLAVETCTQGWRSRWLGGEVGGGGSWFSPKRNSYYEFLVYVERGQAGVTIQATSHSKHCVKSA